MLDIGEPEIYVLHLMLNRVAGLQVERHRRAMGMSPEQFAHIVGVSGMTVRRVESGLVPYLSTQKKFADALEVPIEALFPTDLDPRRTTKAYMGRSKVAA